MADSSPLVTVVVLSHDRPALLERALASVAGQTYPRLEVIVIDNYSASSPQVRDLLRAFPSFRLIANAENLGFTGGMNQGLAEAAGDYAYLTEDDIELEPGCVALLIDHLRQHPEVGLAGPVMWNRRSPTIRCAGGEFALGSIYRMTIVGENQSELAERGPFETMLLPGAMVAARTGLLRELGGFRPDFFMYREDVELCQRVLRAGRTIVVVPAARVYHYEPNPSTESPVLAFHKNKNLAALYLLHGRFRVLPGFFLRYGLFGFLRSLISDPMNVPALVRSWWWVATRAPRLLAERSGAGHGGPASGARFVSRVQGSPRVSNERRSR